MYRCFIASFAFAISCIAVAADDSSLAKQLSNPISDLISLPFQHNFDNRVGPIEGGRTYRLNIQPVIPFELTEDLNLINRTIVPVINQEDIFPGSGDQTGLGDTVQSLFFSPKGPTSGGVTWGVGPVFLFPTATEPLLGAEKWGIGPTAVVLKQTGPWTIGALANHVWSFAGSDNRNDVNNTFIQPFLAYNTPNAWTFTLQSETTYFWETEVWNAPVHFLVAKVFEVGDQTYQIQAGPRYYVDSPVVGSQEWGFRLNWVMLFPK
ncbi:transporter [Microbulbifer agarilyticus]|uniref:transporter n=1 Tax=Microbulbifer agarilyticus TaxID=260552 RepID=UPI001C94B004|nr:transporter [Microbulbifer agarilyticus]MBY6188849.1 transporter [Microbulbifer agarilyticus]